MDGLIIGVLGLQGDVAEHVRMLRDVGVEARVVKYPAELEELDGLVIPGGESTTIGRLLDRYGERRLLAVVNVAYVIALAGYGFTDNVLVACACYLAYTFIMPLSAMASATYLQKVADPADLAPSFAMGTTMQHAAAIVVPVTAGYILNFYGYQIPFVIACGFACLTFLVTRRLDPIAQRAPGRLAADKARLATGGASDK